MPSHAPAARSAPPPAHDVPAAPAGGRLKALTPLISGLSMIYNQLLSATFGVFLAGFLGAQAYGTVNLARNLFANAAFLSPLGLDLALQRHLGASVSQDTAAAEVAWLRLITFGLASLLVTALLIGGASALEAHVFPHAGFATVLVITMLALPFNTDLSVLGGAFRGRYRPVPSVIATYVVQPTARVVAILALSMLVPAFWATIYGSLIAVIVAWLPMAYIASRAFPARLPNMRRTAATAATVLIYAPIMGLSTFVYTMARTLDTMVLGAYGALADVGRYAVVLMMCQLVGTVGGALGQTLGTSVASAAAAQDKPRIIAILSNNMDLSALLCAPCCVAVALWGRDVDLLLGPSYQIPTIVFAVAATTQWLFTVTHNCSVALSMTGRHTTELWNNVAALVIEALGCLLLVPPFGMAGAACATLIMVFSLNVIRQIQIGRMLGDSLVRVRLLAPLALSIVLAIPFGWIEARAGFRAWWLTGLLAGGFGVVSFGTVIALLATPQQKDLVLKALRRNRA